MTSYVANWSSCVSYSPSCCCVWYYMAKQCFLVTIPNEKLGSLKTPLGSLSRLLFLKYPLCHPLFLSHSSPSLMCFDHHFDGSCHLRIFQSHISFQAKPRPTQLILKLTLMSHDIAIYETAFPSLLPATWFWLPHTLLFGALISYFSTLFSYSSPILC